MIIAMLMMRTMLPLLMMMMMIMMRSEGLAPNLDLLEAPLSAVVEKVTGAVMKALRLMRRRWDCEGVGVYVEREVAAAAVAAGL